VAKRVSGPQEVDTGVFLMGCFPVGGPHTRSGMGVGLVHTAGGQTSVFLLSATSLGVATVRW